MKYSIFILLVLALFSCKKKGCTDPKALNYNPDAKADFSLCDYPKHFRITKVRVDFDTNWINSWTTQSTLDTYIEINDNIPFDTNIGPIGTIFSDTIFNNTDNYHEEYVNFEGPIVFDAPLWYHDRINIKLYDYDAGGSDIICQTTFTHPHIYYDNRYPQYLQTVEDSYKITFWLDYY